MDRWFHPRGMLLLIKQQKLRHANRHYQSLWSAIMYNIFIKGQNHERFDCSKQRLCPCELPLRRLTGQRNGQHEFHRSTEKQQPNRLLSVGISHNLFCRNLRIMKGGKVSLSPRLIRGTSFGPTYNLQPIVLHWHHKYFNIKSVKTFDSSLDSTFKDILLFTFR